MTLKNVALSLIAGFGALLFILAPGQYWWLLGASIFIVAWLLILLTVVPSLEAASRGRWAFLALIALFLGLVATALMGYVQSNGLASQLAFEALGALAFVGSRLWAAVLGGVVAFFVSLIFFVGVGYFSSIYVIGLHEEEVGFWNAFKSYIYLLLGVNLAWLVVEDGKIVTLRKQGYVNKWLSRGKIIIKPGNAIVTERGGSITGIHGPGIILTRKDERIRGNVVYDLRPQVAIQTVKNVITADQIPLEIELGIGYKITPFEEGKLDLPPRNGDNGNGNGKKNGKNSQTGSKVLKEKKFGLFPVSEATIMRAAFKGTAGGWKGFGDNAPIGQLRDQIMAHDFSEIFEVTTKDADLKIRVNQRQVKRIEDAILETLNGFADAAIGLTFTFIDIREIRLPEDVVEAILMRLKAGEEAQAIHKIEGERNNVRGDMVTSILNGIQTGTGRRIGDIELQLATVFAQISKRALTDDVLGHQYIDMLKRLAEGEGTKIFTTPNTPLEMKDIL